MTVDCILQLPIGVSGNKNNNEKVLVLCLPEAFIFPFYLTIDVNIYVHTDKLSFCNHSFDVFANIDQFSIYKSLYTNSHIVHYLDNLLLKVYEYTTMFFLLFFPKADNFCDCLPG